MGKYVKDKVYWLTGIVQDRHSLFSGPNVDIVAIFDIDPIHHLHDYSSASAVGIKARTVRITQFDPREIVNILSNMFCEVSRGFMKFPSQIASLFNLVNMVVRGCLINVLVEKLSSSTPARAICH